VVTGFKDHLWLSGFTHFHDGSVRYRYSVSRRAHYYCGNRFAHFLPLNSSATAGARWFWSQVVLESGGSGARWFWSQVVLESGAKIKTNN